MSDATAGDTGEQAAVVRCGCVTLRNGAVATCADHNWGMDRLEQPPGNARDGAS